MRRTPKIDLWYIYRIGLCNILYAVAGHTYYIILIYIYIPDNLLDECPKITITSDFVALKTTITTP